ncbi:expressed unknown protein [Seminavis robusta]|uniref:Ribosomal RNA methyltransferase FtsJ domain-containing protein n=1 Tax=Seminavis robusta TaxID=568900 RepID=A0A9N8ES70_9STRA|nr:expressed unknown protein [Seminavis robusta]|eukprot:Sro1802_g298560.1 n/a (388) ;mRNA; f:11549-12712
MEDEESSAAATAEVTTGSDSVVGVPENNPNEKQQENGKGEASNDMSFYDALRAASKDYRRLCKEKELHESSRAMEAAADARRKYFETHERAQNGQPVTPSFGPYKKHYRKYLEKHLTQYRNGRFCDIGSAPGGLPAFLCDRLGMTGVAFSLPEEDGGFRMKFHSTTCHFSDECDMSVPGAWKSQLYDVLKGETFDFINLGITLQWRKPVQKVEDESEMEDQSAEEKTAEDTRSEQRDHRLAMQEIIKNELFFALQSIDDGGSVMVTLPNSDHPNTFLYLHYLINCIASEGNLMVMPTPKLSRKPVYVLVENISTSSQGVQDLVNFLLSTDVTPENDSKWLVESWEEALPAFEACRTSLEHVWRLQLKQLKKDRNEAENKYGGAPVEN